jgi:putative endonuclease
VVRWLVYLLRCADGTLYCGMTNDLERRLAAHRAGRGARYTRGRAPLELLHVERARGRGDALRREAAWKRLPRIEKLRRIAVATAAAGAPQRVRRTRAGLPATTA